MKNVSLYIDLAFCIIVLPVMAMIFPVERWFHNFPRYVFSVGLWLYSLYFINRLVTVPFLFSNSARRLAAAGLIIASLVITGLLASVTLYIPKPSIHDLGITRVFPHVQQYQQAIWSLFMIVVTFSFAVGLLIQTNSQKAHRQAVEAERDKAEIELYKAQIKPHFMFNTLNSLYGLFLTESPKALESLEKFISMMRYIYSASQRNLVPLADEVDYIRQYVGLQSLRLNEMTTVDFSTDISDNNVLIPPMLLVTFVENCFKHGVSPVQQSTITIDIRERDGHFEFATANYIFPVKRIGEHMGIANCRRRLDLLFQGRHKLINEVQGNIYKVKLSIDLSA